MVEPRVTRHLLHHTSQHTPCLPRQHGGKLLQLQMEPARAGRILDSLQLPVACLNVVCCPCCSKTGRADNDQRGQNTGLRANADARGRRRHGGQVRAAHAHRRVRGARRGAGRARALGAHLCVPLCVYLALLAKTMRRKPCRSALAAARLPCTAPTARRLAATVCASTDNRP